MMCDYKNDMNNFNHKNYYISQMCAIYTFIFFFALLPSYAFQHCANQINNGANNPVCWHNRK